MSNAERPHRVVCDDCAFRSSEAVEQVAAYLRDMHALTHPHHDVVRVRVGGE